MAIKIKPKSFGPVFVSIDEARTVRYGTSVDSVTQVAPPVASPADCLLFSLASCVAISLQMAAEQEHMVLAPFQLEATSRKAEDLPSRFGSFEVTVPRSIAKDKATCEKLLKKAKRICTVSNTLNAEIEVRLSE